jgi:Ca2+-binding EF-hand superfamily protein
MLIMSGLVLAVIFEKALEQSKAEMTQQMVKIKKVEENKILKLESLFNARDMNADGTIDRAEFEELMLGEPMQNTLELLGISVEEADEMFRICDYEKAEKILPRLLAEGLIQGLRPVTGKDILKLDQNGKRVSAALSGVLKESTDQQRRIKAVIHTASTLLEEIRTCEQILMNPDRHKAMEVMKKKLNERAHLLHPSVTTLSQHDYGVTGIDDEHPAICHTSRGSGRLVILPSTIKNMRRDADLMEAQLEGTTKPKEKSIGKMIQFVKSLFIRVVLNAIHLDLSSPVRKEFFIPMLNKLGVKQITAEKAFTIMDQNQDGYISAEEFMNCLSGERADIEMDPTLVSIQYVFFLKAFEVMGAARDRDLTIDQFRTYMEQFGCPSDEAAEIFTLLDIDGGGTLSLFEFARGLTLKVGMSQAGPGFFDKITFAILKRAIKRAGGAVEGTVPLHMTSQGFETLLTQLSVSREIAKQISGKMPMKNGMISIPKFLESLAVAQSGQVYELREQILTHAVTSGPLHADKMLQLKAFAEATIQLGVNREDAYNLFEKVDRDNLGTCCLRDLLLFCTETYKKHRPHPAVALQKVCFLMVFEKCDPEEIGEITEEAFCRMMAVNGVVRAASQEVFRTVDSDHGGTLSLEEFSRILAMDTDSGENLRMVKSAILREAFNMIDVDGSRMITKEELSKGIMQYMAIEDVDRIWRKLDHDNDGYISFPEFTRTLVYWATPVNDPRPAMAVKYALSKVLFNEVMGLPLDAPTDGPRGISEEGFIRYLCALGTNRDDARRVFKSIDKDQSGTVEWNEFSHVFAMTDPSSEAMSEGLQYAWRSVRKVLWDRILKQLDFDSAGKTVNYMDFEKTMKPFGISASDLQFCFRWLDVDQSGDVSKQEFQNRFCPTD